MSNKRHQLQYTYPPDTQKCNAHRLSMRIFKGIERDQQKIQCQCCERRVGFKGQTGQCCYDNEKLAFLGPGIPLLFAFIKNSIKLLISFIIVFAGYAIYSHLRGGYCNQSGTCTDVFDTLSIINQTPDSAYLTNQNYLVLGFVIIFVITMQYYRYNFRVVEDQADDIITSPSDYALILRRLPPDTVKADIEKMIDHKRATITPDQRQKTLNLKVVDIIMSFSMTEYKKTKQENIDQFYKLLGEEKITDFKAKELPKLQKTASVAVIIFSRQQSKQIFRYKPNILQKFLQCLWTSCLPKSHLLIKGERVAIERAPQPDDIVWENCKISMEGAICRKTMYSLISIVILGLGGLIQYGLALAQKKSPQDSQTRLVMSTVSSITVTVINTIIQIFLVFSSQRERNETLTEFNTVLMVKISFFQFLNTGVFVVLANFLADPTGFSLQKGFVFQVTQVMIMNAIIPNLTVFILNYSQVVLKIQRCLIEKGTIKKSQSDANLIYQAPIPEIPYKYAYLFKTLWLTAFYAPLTPVVVPISAFGLILNYFVEKCLFGKAYSSPNTISSMLNDSAIELLEYFALILSLGQFIVYLYFVNFRPEIIPANWSIPIYASIVISILNLLLPMDGLNNKLFKMPKDNFVYPDYQLSQSKFQVTYEMTNPGYQSNRKRHRDAFLLNSLFGGGQNNQLNTGLNLLGLGGMNPNGLLNQNNNIYQNPNPNQLQNPNMIPNQNVSQNPISNPNLNPNQNQNLNPLASLLPGNNQNNRPPINIEMQPLHNPPPVSPSQMQNLQNSHNNSLTMDDRSDERRQLLNNSARVPQNLNISQINPIILNPNNNSLLLSPSNILPNNLANSSIKSPSSQNMNNNFNQPFNQPFNNQSFNNQPFNNQPVNNQPFNQPFQPNQSFNQPNQLNQPFNQGFNSLMMRNTPNSHNQFFAQQAPPGFNQFPPFQGNPLPPINLMQAGVQESERAYSSTRGLKQALKINQMPNINQNNP